MKSWSGLGNLTTSEVTIIISSYCHHHTFIRYKIRGHHYHLKLSSPHTFIRYKTTQNWKALPLKHNTAAENVSMRRIANFEFRRKPTILIKISFHKDLGQHRYRWYMHHQVQRNRATGLFPTNISKDSIGLGMSPALWEDLQNEIVLDD